MSQLGMPTSVLKKRDRHKSKNEENRNKPNKDKEFKSLTVFGRKPSEQRDFSRSIAVSASLVYSFLFNQYKEGRRILEEDYSTKQMEYRHLLRISWTILSIRDSTLRTIWVRREIDKITSMIYFIIVIVTFIIALFVIDDFEDRLLVIFQGGTGGGNQTRGLTIHHINAAITADQANDPQTIKTEIEAAKEVLMPPEEGRGQ